MENKRKFKLFGNPNRIVELGDTIEIGIMKIENNKLVKWSDYEYILDEKTIKKFLHSNFISEFKKDDDKISISSISDVILSISRRYKMSYKEVLSMYQNMLRMSSVSAYTFIMQELSKIYNNNIITNQSTVYMINSQSILLEQPISKVKNYAYFYRKEDAIKALEICQPILDLIHETHSKL